jgi:hypothetical protein
LACETSRLPHFLDSRLTYGGVVAALLAGRPLPPRRFPVLISVRGSVDPRAIVRLEGLGRYKNRTTSSGIEPANLRLAAVLQPTTLPRTPSSGRFKPRIIFTVLVSKQARLREDSTGQSCLGYSSYCTFSITEYVLHDRDR